MSRVFCVPGVFFIFSAFVLLFIVSISLPYITAMDITHVNTGANHSQISGDQAMTELKLGIWSYCYTLVNGNVACSSSGHGYSLSIHGSVNNNTVTIGSMWTRGLAVHPVACGVTFIALLLSFSQHIAITLFASLVSFLAAALTLIAFAIDIALYAYFRNQMDDLNLGGKTSTGPGFWLTFASLILLILGGFTVCCGRRRDRMSSATLPTTTQPGLFDKFRRN